MIFDDNLLSKTLSILQRNGSKYKSIIEFLINYSIKTKKFFLTMFPNIYYFL